MSSLYKLQVTKKLGSSYSPSVFKAALPERWAAAYDDNVFSFQSGGAILGPPGAPGAPVSTYNHCCA